MRRCCASLYAFQSVEYRRQNGQPILTGMGVVIQEMVDAEAAGVMFTRDPVTGNPERIVITANYGLGEVSAKSDVVGFLLLRTERAKGYSHSMHYVFGYFARPEVWSM